MERDKNMTVEERAKDDTALKAVLDGCRENHGRAADLLRRALEMERQMEAAIEAQFGPTRGLIREMRWEAAEFTERGNALSNAGASRLRQMEEREARAVAKERRNRR